MPKTKKIAILATDGVENSEFVQPMAKLFSAGYEPVIVSPNETFKSWSNKNWHQTYKSDLPLQYADAEDFLALVIPGGTINSDTLRVNQKAVSLVKQFHKQGKLIAAICHAPWVLIEAGVVNGATVTSYRSIKTDLVNAGAKWIDKSVVKYRNIITSRNPGDLEGFSNAIINTF